MYHTSYTCIGRRRESGPNLLEKAQIGFYGTARKALAGLWLPVTGHGVAHCKNLHVVTVEPGQQEKFRHGFSVVDEFFGLMR